MYQQFKPALWMFVWLTILTGVIYPVLISAAAWVMFPHQAGGSLLKREGLVIGSRLIGQPFDSPRYFWGRPSATSVPYDGGASSGSNLGPMNPEVQKAVSQRLQTFKAADPENHLPVSVELVTASGSGLDPHISPASAAYQAPRVARARNLNLEVVQALVAKHTEPRQLGLLGEPRVNVLELNLALDQIK